jgi:hypothetical protein
MLPPVSKHLRRALPWIVSTAALAYVFGWLTDWHELVEATRSANLPLYVAITFADKLIFFVLWTFLQVTAIRRLIGPMSVASLISLRGGTELLRTLSNPLADAAFLVGLVHMTRGSPGRVIMAASVPGFVHGVVLIAQLTLALLLLEGGAAYNRDVAIAAGAGWLILAGAVVGVHVTRASSSSTLARARTWLNETNFRAFLPMLGWFVVLALLDVSVQWLATHAFGVPIGFLSLLARIPILYIAFLIPSFGNFGTRELVWASLFSDLHPRENLIAYAFATNALFLIFHVVIGVVFLPRAIALLREMRAAQRAGEEIPVGPLVHDPGDP